MKRLLAGAAFIAIAAYGGAIAWLVANETALIFENRHALGDLRPAKPYEEIDAPVEGAQQSRARAWLMPGTGAAPAAPWVIFLHGNSATIASRMNIHHYERLRALGLNVMAPEYRGYGGLGGEPTEAGLAEDARNAYELLRRQKNVAPDRIVIYGWSLGSAVAVTLASQVDEGAVVLEGAPASIVDIGSQRYPFFPIRWLIRNPFESIARIARVGSPLLFLHSPEDGIIPIAEGRRLFDAAPPPKQFVEVAGGHIYASEKDPRFFTAVGAFLRAHRLLP
ncbi:MAG TPA: alpha/beta fold hydrolase [Vicinamibacterales bacterium]|nr:alpha/beta fold hydrolase [Vicinamibacterales bacterium]